MGRSLYSANLGKWKRRILSLLSLFLFLPLLHFISQDIEALMNIQIYANPIPAPYIIHTKHIHFSYNYIPHISLFYKTLELLSIIDEFLQELHWPKELSRYETTEHLIKLAIKAKRCSNLLIILHSSPHPSYTWKISLLSPS